MGQEVDSIDGLMRRDLLAAGFTVGVTGCTDRRVGHSYLSGFIDVCV